MEIMAYISDIALIEVMRTFLFFEVIHNTSFDT